MDLNNGAEGLNIQDLAAQLLGNAGPAVEETPESEEETETPEPQAGHPAWQSILSAIPEEYHASVKEQLQQWDAGVSRRFQKIHDQYKPLEALADYDPDELREAVNVYQALNTDPQNTWELIGKAYGLSPQQVSQAASAVEEHTDEDFELDDLPPAIKRKLAKLDVHDDALNAIASELLARQAAEKEAQEDQEFEEYMEELHDTYGDFDDDYVTGLIAAGIDGAEAVEQFNDIINARVAAVTSKTASRNAPKVMSSGGGVPTERIDFTKLSNQDTQALITEMLRQANES